MIEALVFPLDTLILILSFLLVPVKAFLPMQLFLVSFFDFTVRFLSFLHLKNAFFPIFFTFLPKVTFLSEGRPLHASAPISVVLSPILISLIFSLPAMSAKASSGVFPFSIDYLPCLFNSFFCIAVLRPIKYIEVGKRKRSSWEWGFLA